MRPPPPPPPPLPPPEIEEVLIVSSKLVIENRRDKDGSNTIQEGKSELISISAGEIIRRVCLQIKKLSFDKTNKI